LEWGLAVLEPVVLTQAVVHLVGKGHCCR
jgi:hypothetical protein